MKKVLFALIACVLCAGMVGGAFAYFTDVEKSTANAASAGTIDIQLADNNETTFTDSGVTASFSIGPLAPGQSLTTNAIAIKNVGTLAISEVYARFAGLTETDGTPGNIEGVTPGKCDISKYLILQNYQESGNGVDWFVEDFTGIAGEANANDYIAYWNGTDGSGWNAGAGAGLDEDGAISLADLVAVNAFGSGDHLTTFRLFDGGNYTPAPCLPAGAIVYVKFTFKLLESVPNSYQGDIAAYTVDFIAAARGDYPDDSLDESGPGLSGYLTP
jgi:predicted ribosomally synthesized peptide with SipW-like signal peptide